MEESATARVGESLSDNDGGFLVRRRAAFWQLKRFPECGPGAGPQTTGQR